MKVVIYGLGEIGKSLAVFFSEISQDVIVLDEDPLVLKDLSSKIDVHAFCGNGASVSFLETLDLEGVDLFIAATAHDENNLLAAHFAKSLFKVHFSVAYLMNAVFMSEAPEHILEKSKLSIDQVISPEKSIAQHIVNNLGNTIFKNVYPGGIPGLNFCVYQFKVGNSFIGSPLEKWREFYREIPFDVLSFKSRGDYAFPSLQHLVQVNDICFFCLSDAHLEKFRAMSPDEKHEASSVVIFGGGRIGLEAAKKIEEKNLDMSQKVVEKETKRAEFVRENLKSTLVLNGSAMDIHLQEEAYIDEKTTVLSLMDDDENNILAALLAKSFGAKKVKVLINMPSYYDILPSLGLSELINPREIIVSEILKIIPLGHVAILKVFGFYSWFLCAGTVNRMSLIHERGIGYFEEHHQVKVAGLMRDGQWMPICRPHLPPVEENDVLVFAMDKTEIIRINTLF